jgi:deoxyribonuclease V
MDLACADVDYRADETVAACLRFSSFEAVEPSSRQVLFLPPAAPYEPGRFYLRELPPLLAVLQGPLDLVVIDGYVWLGPERPGLGAHLHEALGVPVLGVAKTAFQGAAAVPVLRGESRRPLFVTAAGVDVNEAAAWVRGMHGAHRVPTLLKQVDRLCRDARRGAPGGGVLDSAP